MKIDEKISQEDVAYRGDGIPSYGEEDQDTFQGESKIMKKKVYRNYSNVDCVTKGIMFLIMK